MKHPEHRILFDAHEVAIGQSGHGRQTETVSRETIFTEEIALTQDSDGRHFITLSFGQARFPNASPHESERYTGLTIEIRNPELMNSFVCGFCGEALF